MDISFLGTKYGIILILMFLIILSISFLIIKNWSTLGQFFLKLIDEKDSISTTRWVMVVQVIVSNIFVWGVWAIMTICDNMDNTVNIPFTIVDIPSGVIAAYGIANGVAGLTKVGQAFANNKKLETPETPILTKD